MNNFKYSNVFPIGFSKFFEKSYKIKMLQLLLKLKYSKIRIIPIFVIFQNSISYFCRCDILVGNILLKFWKTSSFSVKENYSSISLKFKKVLSKFEVIKRPVEVFPHKVAVFYPPTRMSCQAGYKNKKMVYSTFNIEFVQQTKKPVKWISARQLFHCLFCDKMSILDPWN